MILVYLIKINIYIKKYETSFIKQRKNLIIYYKDSIKTSGISGNTKILNIKNDRFQFYGDYFQVISGSNITFTAKKISIDSYDSGLELKGYNIYNTTTGKYNISATGSIGLISEEYISLQGNIQLYGGMNDIEITGYNVIINNYTGGGSLFLQNNGTDKIIIGSEINIYTKTTIHGDIAINGSGIINAGSKNINLAGSSINLVGSIINFTGNTFFNGSINLNGHPLSDMLIPTGSLILGNSNTDYAILSASGNVTVKSHNSNVEIISEEQNISIIPGYVTGNTGNLYLYGKNGGSIVLDTNSSGKIYFKDGNTLYKFSGGSFVQV